MKLFPVIFLLLLFFGLKILMPNCVGLQIPRDRKKLSDGKFLAVGCNTVSRALSVLRLECVLAGKSCTGGKMMALLARDTHFSYFIEQQLNKSIQAATYRTKIAAHS